MIIEAGKFPAFIVSLGDWEKKPRLKAKTSVRFFTYREVEDSRLREVLKKFLLDHLTP
jgi:hypothetical protein